MLFKEYKRIDIPYIQVYKAYLYIRLYFIETLMH